VQRGTRDEKAPAVVLLALRTQALQVEHFTCTLSQWNVCAQRCEKTYR
jgi:hypothetical protein